MKQLMKQKRGVAGLDFFKAFIIMIFIVGIVAFALVIAGANLKSSTTDTDAQNVIANFTSGVSTIGSSIGTWITLAGLVVLISIIVIVVLVVNRMNAGKGGL